MVGTLFLFAYWPSFNGAVGAGTTMHRAIINTYLSIACSVIASIIISKLVHGGKLNMEIVLNASLAGGVAVGSVADLITSPPGAMMAGFITGSVSALGFAYISAFVKKHLRLHDTCGVLNLHGIPGVIGALISAIVASRAEGTFGSNLPISYPQQALRTPQEQAGYQLAGLSVCLGIAIFSGLLTGFITSREWFQPPHGDALFDDKIHWANCVIEHEELHELKAQMSLGGAGSKSDSKGNNYSSVMRDEDQ
jgi:ammonium transporter Rh